MAVKYVKDFAFDSGFGFTGSSGKTPVRGYMRGGAVKEKGFDNSTRNPMSKFPDIAPAMVGKPTKGMGGLTPQTKKLAAYDKPHGAGKKGAKVAQYAKGGAVKKANGGKIPSMIAPVAPPSIVEEYDSYKAPRTAEFRDANRNGIDDRDELMQAKRMNERIRAGMRRPRMGRREMAMIGREDERMMGRTSPKRARGLPSLAEAPVRQTGYQMEAPYMPEYNLDPEEIREYSRGRTFSPEAMYAKGGKVTGKKAQAKVGKVMSEFKEGKLHSGSKEGPKVKNPKQAIAIALSEARKTGAKIPKKAKGGEIKAAVHKHERTKHPGEPMTKLRKGGMACD